MTRKKSEIRNPKSEIRSPQSAVRNPSVRPLLIAFAGAMHSGKDTAAGLLEKMAVRAGYKVCRLAFATPIKLEAAIICEVPVKQIESNKVWYRPLLQFLGDERKRRYGEAYYVQLLEKARASVAQAFPREKLLFIISDLRFLYEVHYVEDLNGVVCLLARSQQPHDPPEARPHHSELDFLQSRSHWRIINDGSILDLETAIIQLWHTVSHFHPRKSLPETPPAPAPRAATPDHSDAQD